MGFSVTRQNFTHNNNVNQGGTTPSITYDQCLFLNLVEDFIHNGFTLYDSEVVDHSGNSSRPQTTSNAQSSTRITELQLGTVSVVLLPGDTVDPLISTNPWFLKITTLDGGTDPNFVSSAKVNDEQFSFATASVIVPDIKPGTFKIIPYYNTGLSIGVGYYTPSIEMPKIGSRLETDLTMSNILPPLTSAPKDYTPRLYTSNPYGYTLTIVNRGFALNIFPQASTEDLQQSGYYVVQRAMGCGGKMTATGNTPLYLITNVTSMSLVDSSQSSSTTTNEFDSILGPQATWFARIIREKDITDQYPLWSPACSVAVESSSVGSEGPYVLMDTNISDYKESLGNVLHRFPDRWQGPVTRDTGEYILLFPFGICSNRFAYTDELDLIAVSKANAYQASQLVPVSVYSETRKYLAGSSNNAQVGNDSGIRVFIYTAGPEITAPTSYSDVNVQATTTITTS